MFDRAIWRAAFRTEHGGAGRIEPKLHAVGRVEIEPRRDQHPAEMPVPDQDHVAVRHRRFHPGQQLVGAFGHLGRGLAARNRVRPHAPVRHAPPNLLGGQALVLAVVPLGQLVGHLVHEQTGQRGGVLGALAGTAQHQRGRQVRAAQVAQHQPGAPRLLLALGGQRNVGAAGVLAGEGPLRLAVTEYVDQWLLVVSHLNIVGRAAVQHWSNERDSRHNVPLLSSNQVLAGPISSEIPNFQCLLIASSTSR